MKTLNKIGLGIALVGSTLTFSTVGMSSAQAALLRGTLNIVGDATLVNGNQANPATDTIIFDSATVGALSSGSFADFIGQSAIISDVSLTQIEGTSYSGTAPNPFITLADGLVFNVDNPFAVERLDIPGNLKLVFTDEGFAGTLVNATGSSLGRGIFSVNSFSTDGSYSATITAVPEPTTTIGLAALGLGAFFTNSLAKKKKEKVNA